ncbi:MAG TPA: 3-hydroxyacyl-ACP dehydratase FabZ [Thermodesulfobacteriota bacterium]|jgi:beta-hydroxyacyl-ACP dehydratase FabZ
MIYNKEEIKNFIPHRDPFLFVDSVIELEPEVRIVASKRFGDELDFFRGHFPGNPIVPGVILLEALAQAGGILFASSYPEKIKEKGRFNVYLMGVESVKFRKPVLPGDNVKLEVKLLKNRLRGLKFSGEAFVGKNKVAEAQIIAAIV